MINITWNIPTNPNGVITMYEICYRQLNSNSRCNMTNTANTWYSIKGLLPITNYTIEVRAYTSVGAGEWSYIQVSTALPCEFDEMIIESLSFKCIYADVEGLSVKVVGSIIFISWSSLDIIYLTSYLLRYRQVDEVTHQDIIIPSSLLGIGLPNLVKGKDYVFQISSVLAINKVTYNGPISSPVTIFIPEPISSTIQSACPLTITKTLPYLISSYAPSSVSQESCSGPLVGISLLAVIVVILLIILTIYTGLVLYHHKRKGYNITK